ncbi:unnamed protein product [Pieris brassicae]|uniref:Uncharacterized protein n=1 Tax=Pieris brassicae TaxID=7116 RepID=A0A9P0TQX3_PIEBR|nr:unnamed protein product [Pieris brassicae]
MASEDARTLSAAPALTAVSGVAAVSAVPAVSVTADDPERTCACAGWPRRQPPVHEILRPKPRRIEVKSKNTQELFEYLIINLRLPAKEVHILYCTYWMMSKIFKFLEFFEDQKQIR